jgi:hypothetical protein
MLAIFDAIRRFSGVIGVTYPRVNAGGLPSSPEPEFS